jgi:PAS domain S-box-containing protein
MKLGRLRLNITQKFIGFLIVLSVIPLLIVGFSSYYISSYLLQDEAKIYTMELVLDQKHYLELYLAQVESLIANISGVDDIRNVLDDQNVTADTYTSLVTHARIGYILNGYSNLNGLVSIDIFTVGGAHYHVGDTLNVKNIRTPVKDKIFTQTIEAARLVYWVGIEDNVNENSTYRKVVTAAKVLNKFSRPGLKQEPVALFLINLSVDDLYNHFSRIDLGEGAFLVIVDGQQRILYHPDKTLLGNQMDPVFMQKLTAGQGTLVEIVSGEKMSVSYARSNTSGWVIMSFVPLKTLTAKTWVIRTTTFAVLLFCFAMVAFFAGQYNKGVVAPIREITRRFKLLQAGTLNAQPPLEARSGDEIGELVQWFNTFVDSLAAKEQSEQALRESEERYALAVRGANDGLWDWDLKSSELYVSPRWKAMLGFNDSDIGSGPDEWLNRVHPDDQQAVKHAINHHLTGLTPHFENEHRLQHKDGAYRWFLARGLAVFGPDGTAYRMAGSHADITERKQAEEELKESLQEKVVLLQEIHHRVKNNLQIVSSLFSLQSDTVQDQQAIEVFKEGQNRIRSMALIHDMLYRTKNLARIDFGEYTRSLTAYLFRSYGAASQGIAANIQSDEVYFGVDTAVPCGLILNELISNALKHAFPNGRQGQISIKCRTLPSNEFTFMVSDTGIGLPQGFDWRKSSSLGLQLVSTLVNQLDAHIEFRGLQGTEITVTFTDSR